MLIPAEPVAKRAHFCLHGMDALHQMLYSIYAFDVDVEIVVQMDHLLYVLDLFFGNKIIFFDRCEPDQPEIM